MDDDDRLREGEVEDGNGMRMERVPGRLFKWMEKERDVDCTR